MKSGPVCSVPVGAAHGGAELRQASQSQHIPRPINVYNFFIPQGQGRGNWTSRKFKGNFPLNGSPSVWNLEGGTSIVLVGTHSADFGLEDLEIGFLRQEQRLVFLPIQLLPFRSAVLMCSHFWFLKDSLTQQVSTECLLCARPFCDYFKYSYFLLTSSYSH